MPVATTIFLTSIINLKRLRKKIQWTTDTIILKPKRKNLPSNLSSVINLPLKSLLQIFFVHSRPLTDSNRKIVIARNEAILMRTLVAIVLRLLRRLKKPSRNDDSSQSTVR